MTIAQKKEQFTIMRADGHSYAEISKELGISKSTCTAWNSELKENIAELETDNAQELKHKYRITRANYIERIGETLERINQAIEKTDFTKIPAEKLLKLKLEYEEKILTECTPIYEKREPLTAQELADEGTYILKQLKAGQITDQQAKTRLLIIEGIYRSKANADNNALINYTEPQKPRS